MSVDVLVVSCPICGAAVRERCTKPGMPGKAREPLTSIAGHPSRIVAAALATGHSEAEAEALAATAAAGQVRRVRAGWVPSRDLTTPVVIPKTAESNSRSDKDAVSCPLASTESDVHSSGDHPGTLGGVEGPE